MKKTSSLDFGIDMLSLLHTAESQLPELLQEEWAWRGLLVNRHLPLIDRVWRHWLDYRIHLHRIYPCKPNEVLFHAHPWPSAMKLIKGTYEMMIGYGQGTEEPPRAGTVILSAGSEYEMIDPSFWHSVRPIGEVTWSLMITAKPWSRSRNSRLTDSGNGKVLRSLSDESKTEILNFFRGIYV